MASATKSSKSGKELAPGLAAALVVLFASPIIVVAQDYDLTPSFGTHDLVSGFEPDPAEYASYAGGSIDLSQQEDSGCVGFVSDAPDIRISYTGIEYDYPLGFITESEADTVLLINAPDGSWYCNDDYSEEFGVSAGIEFITPMEGIFDIWVGVYEEEDSYTPATLLVTELGLDEDASQTGNGDSESDLGSGTAFSINDRGNLLTNYHVIEGCNSLTFRLPGQDPVAASVVATDIDADLALLKAELLTVPATFDLQNRPRLGDEIVVFGFPLLGDLSSQGNLTSGLVSALTGLEDDMGTFQISAQIQPGNSGGPVINRSGSVVGVVVSQANEQYFTRQAGTTPQNVNFAITGNEIHAFLNANRMKFLQATNTQQYLSIADIAERAQRYTGAVVCY